MSTKEVIIRKAQSNELDWINEQYDNVRFKHSVFEQEFITIAEVEGVKAGLGRLQKINENSAELGGIYVLDQFRGLGIARQLVETLLANGLNYQTIYCIPFTHLKGFYMGFGFEVAQNLDNAPDKIKDKLCWCNSEYCQDTVLLVKHNR